MKTNSKWLFTPIFIALFAVAAFAQDASVKAKPTPVPSPQPSATPVKLERDKPFDAQSVKFPEVDGWELSAKTTYPAKELGYSVNYESEDAGRVTVYVYNGGQKNIPNSLEGVVEAEMKKAQNEIAAVVEMGYYESAKEVKKATVNIGGDKGKVKALHVQYDLKSRGNSLDSRIYIFPYNNHFVKFRVTSPKSETVDVDLAGLFEALDLLFSY